MSTNSQSPSDMLIRISEIEVYPEYSEQYLTYAKNVGLESVANEPGVICIYPMVQQRDPYQIRILEIYENQSAYREHLLTPWFQTYKKCTIHMVKKLDLVDMSPLNPEAMPDIFTKSQITTNENNPKNIISHGDNRVITVRFGPDRNPPHAALNNRRPLHNGDFLESALKP